MDNGWFDSVSGWLAADGVRVAAILAGALVLNILVRLVARRLFKAAIRTAGGRMTTEQEARVKTLAGVIRGIMLAVIVIVTLLMVLNELDYNVGPLLAGAGIVGVALGFGAQTLIKDLIGGYFILMEGQFNLGDWVQVEGNNRSVGGTVEEIRMRTTLLRDFEGTLHIVPNGEVGIASNFTRGWARAVVDIDIYYREDIDRVLKILREACKKAAGEMELAGEITEGPEVLGVQELTGRTVVVRVVARTTPYNKIDVGRELRGILVRELEQNGVVMGRGAGRPA
ncbi:MAG: mechanosensitive ion channel family protein [Thermoleophilia bacterium]